jgi:hypothetical protein
MERISRCGKEDENALGGYIGMKLTKAVKWEHMINKIFRS